MRRDALFFHTEIARGHGTAAHVNIMAFVSEPFVEDGGTTHVTPRGDFSLMGFGL